MDIYLEPRWVTEPTLGMMVKCPEVYCMNSPDGSPCAVLPQDVTEQYDLENLYDEEFKWTEEDIIKCKDTQARNRRLVADESTNNGDILYHNRPERAEPRRIRLPTPPPPRNRHAADPNLQWQKEQAAMFRDSNGTKGFDPWAGAPEIWKTKKTRSQAMAGVPKTPPDNPETKTEIAEKWAKFSSSVMYCLQLPPVSEDGWQPAPPDEPPSQETIAAHNAQMDAWAQE